MLETLSLFLGIWMIFFLLAICAVSLPPYRRESIFRVPISEHLPAESRAKSLLRDVLDDVQYQQLITYGYLDVASPSTANRFYRIPDSGGLVRVYERGCPIMELCVQPAEPLPHHDVVVMHKLMIEGNEQEYLQKANRFAPGVISPASEYLL